MVLRCSVYPDNLVDGGQNGATAGAGGTAIGAGAGGAGGAGGREPDASAGGAGGAGGTTGGMSGAAGAAGQMDGAGGGSDSGGAAGANAGGASIVDSAILDIAESGGSAGTDDSGPDSTTTGTGGAAGAGGVADGAAGSDVGTDDVVVDVAGDKVDAPPDVAPPVGAIFTVGSFNKIGGTGSQVVGHSLGQVPKALIVWTVARTNEVPGSNFYYSIGVSDMSTSIALAMSSRDEVSPSTSSRRMAPKIMTLVQWGETTLAEADLTAFDASSFTLNWAINDTQPYVLHYIAIGGPQVTAKLVNWQTPTSPSTKVVSGVGFSPEAVLHFHAGASFISIPPFSMTNAVVGMGAMAKSGAQWAIQVAEASGVTTTVASRAQRTNAAIYMYTDSNPPSITKEASFVSMNADGFTLDFSNANTNAAQVYSLALGGLKASVGAFVKTTAAAPTSQSIPTPFRPGALFLASYQMPASTGQVREPICSYGVGASDGFHKASSVVGAADGTSPTADTAHDKTSKVFLKVNEPPLQGEADMASFDPAGFAVNWTTNDAVASQICFVALGAP